MPAPRVDAFDAPEMAPRGQAPVDPRGQLWGGDWVHVDPVGGYKESRADGAWSPEGLRGLARFMYVSIVVDTIIAHVREWGYPQTTPHGVGFGIRLRESKKSPTKAEQKRIEELTSELFWCGVLRDENDRFRRDRFPTYLAKVARDSLEIDRDFTEFVPDRLGRPAMFRALDGASARWGEDDETGELYPIQVARGGANVFRLLAEWRYDDPQGYKARIGIRTGRTNSESYGYGYPELEFLRPAILGLARSLETAFSYLNHGLTGAGILAFSDRTPKPQMLSAASYMRAVATGAVNRGRLALMTYPEGQDPKFINFASAALKDMEFLELFRNAIKALCAGFKVSPAIIGHVFGNEGQSSSLQSSSGKDQIDYAKEKGIWTLARHLMSGVDSYWLRPRAPEFEVFCGGLDNQTEKERNERNKESLDWMSENEVRAREDMRPIDWAKIENPADLPPKMRDLWWQMKSAEQAQQQGGEDDGDGAAEQPDGFDEDAMDRLLAQGQEDGSDDDDDALSKSILNYVQWQSAA